MRILGNGNVGIGSSAPGCALHVERAGTAKANLDMLCLTNAVNAADMDGTGLSLKFRQFAYDGSSPAAYDSARISAYTEQDWTVSTATTRDSELRFETSLNGTLASKLSISSAGNVLPGSDSAQDFGADATRWANVYADNLFTGDLHLTNERGSWTVIEEENYLTLRNNKNGKMFKIVMQEISEE